MRRLAVALSVAVLVGAAGCGGSATETTGPQKASVVEVDCAKTYGRAIYKTNPDLRHCYTLRHAADLSDRAERRLICAKLTTIEGNPYCHPEIVPPAP